MTETRLALDELEAKIKEGYSVGVVQTLGPYSSPLVYTVKASSYLNALKDREYCSYKISHVDAFVYGPPHGKTIHVLRVLSPEEAAQAPVTEKIHHV